MYIHLLIRPGRPVTGLDLLLSSDSLAKMLEGSHSTTVISSD